MRPLQDQDDETTQFVKQARRALWQHCHKCSQPLEIKDGRNHWFKYDPLEAETLDSRQNPFASASRPTSPREYRSEFAPFPTAPARPRPASYEEDPYFRRMHEQQREEHLTRRMQSFDAFAQLGGHADFDRNRTEYDFDEPAHDPRDRRRQDVSRGYDIPYPEDDYHRRAATVVAPSPPQAYLAAAPPPPHSAFEPPSRPPAFERAVSGFDYSPAVQRARGMRYDSPERYDDYATETMQDMLENSSAGNNLNSMSNMNLNGNMNPNSPGNNINAGSARAPNVRRRPPPQATREHNKHEPPRSSILAGLGDGQGMHRVEEWVTFVEPGVGPGDVGK
ncbi:hypothetical protein N0V88_002974 [Collariella sp. IMI 366227]|nr:hypothetical protein N0V88_002974 [Collariella sp. IMI 366227]